MGIAKVLKMENLQNEDIILRRELSKLSKEELIDKIINVEKSKKAQENFILNISHDLRSPLNIILSILQCYKSEYMGVKSGSKLKEHMDIIKRNGYKILKLIDNLIDITKLEQTHYKLEKQNIDIINLIEWDISSIDKYAKQKDISLVFDTNVEECIMSVDPSAIDRIIMNLLSNAIKFSPQGSSIYINTWQKDDNLEISVKDEGIGIPLDEQKNIFNRFVQSSKNKNNEYCGSGIGLDLVRYLTELHDGTIQLKSEEDKGAEFIINMPIVKSNSVSSVNRNLMYNRDKVDLMEIEFSDIYL